MPRNENNCYYSRLPDLRPARMSASLKRKQGWLAHYRELLGAWRNKNSPDGEDAVQDVAVKLLERGIVDIEEPRAYLARGVSNGVIDQHRRRAILPVRAIDELAEREHPTVADGQSAYYAGELLTALMAALQELPPACQRVYLQHRLEGWTHAEIAADMGISRSMVEKHMIRALQHIGERLKQHAPSD
ncbi:sigma-70 family RNA polymerase sigma factor [Achromobacter sp. ACRQX]|nr:sigma-70 family RNA polymerase sigma factor [Achromobacter sp. ACRQX]MCG7327541.1 sigma-70 family RNA polymerase sigma factor [Achromobacter sp. ACRQX]